MSTTDVREALRAVSAQLLPEASDLGLAMSQTIRDQLELYRNEQGVTVDELDSSCIANVQFVFGNLAGVEGVTGDIPREIGRLRAEQGVPYAAVLQAYRIGGRFMWETLVARADAGVRDMVLRAAAEMWAVTDELQGEVTDAYRTTLLEKARHDTHVRAAHLGAILDGDPTTLEHLLESVSVLDLPRHAEYLVVTAQGSAVGREALPRVDEQLRRRRNVASAWRLEQELQDGIVALRPGITPDDIVAELQSVTIGRVGVSEPFDRIVDGQAAQRQARLARLATTPGSREVLRYGASPLAVLLASNAEGAEVMATQVLGPVLELRREDRDMLLHTARVWLDVAGSTSSAAETLHVHRNTVRYRLGRFQEVCGRDLAKPLDAAEVHLALEAVRVFALADTADAE